MARAAPAPPGLLPELAPAEVAPLAITEMLPVGQYAHAIGFSDGRSSGIDTLACLREMAGG